MNNSRHGVGVLVAKKYRSMKKYLFLLFCLPATLVFAQQEKQLIFGLGPTFETSWSMADEITGTGDYYKMGVSENIGLRIQTQYNIKKFGLQGYAQLKRVSIRYVQDDLTPEDQVNFRNFRASAFQSGIGMEVGVYVGGNFPVGKHQLYLAAGAGMVYNNFNGYGGGSFGTYVIAPATGGSFMDHNINGGDQLVVNSITPTLNAQVAFRQQLKNPKLGLVYLVENKWGMTSAMPETFNYNLELEYDGQNSNYHASFSNIRTMNLSFSVLMTFQAGKGVSSEG